MNVTESEWRVTEDRLQRLSDMLAWQWRLRISAWKTGDASVVATCEEAEARTTAYIKYLREVLTVPYTIQDRSTVICQGLGIRCHPDSSQHSAAASRKGKSRVLHPNRKGKKTPPAPAVEPTPAVEPVQAPVTGRGRGRMDRLDRVPWPTGPNPPVIRRPKGPPPPFPLPRVCPVSRGLVARGGRFID